MLKTLFLIGTGGFIGSVSRFLFSRYVQSFIHFGFPFGTMVVNLSGCFLIGIFLGISERTAIINADWRMFLTVGFCGGFTTFSTFAQENLSLLQDAEYLWASLYTGLSVFAGILAAFFGQLMTKLIL